MKKLLLALLLLSSPAEAVTPTTPMGDANLTVNLTQTVVATTKAWTAGRTIFLPPAAATCIGQFCTPFSFDFFDIANAVGASTQLTIQAATGDLINGSSTFVVSTPNVHVALWPVTGTSWYAQTLVTGTAVNTISAGATSVGSCTSTYVLFNNAGVLGCETPATWLQTANNLSDVPTASTARTNLGLSAMATATAGTGLAISAGALNLQPPTASVLGGVESISCAASNWISNISTLGVPSCTQPQFSDLAGTLTNAQCPVATSGLKGCVIPDGTIITVSGGGNITVPKATNAVFGVAETDNTSVVAAAGVLSAVTQCIINAQVTANGPGNKTICPSVQGNGDSNVSIAATTQIEYTTAIFTASRTWTLPSNLSYGKGNTLIIEDVVGGISPTNTLTVAGAGGDTINGAANRVFSTAFSVIYLIADGSGHWTINIPAGTGTVTSVACGSGSVCSTFTTSGTVTSPGALMELGPSFGAI